MKTLSLLGGYGVNIVNILYGLTLIGIFLTRNEKVEYRSKVTYPICFFVVYFLLQTLFRPQDHDVLAVLAFWKDSFLFMAIPFFFVSIKIRREKQIFLILVTMCAANIYMDTYFWRWVRWISFDTFADKMKTVNGTFGDVGGCNEWAAFFSTYTLVLIASLYAIKGYWKRAFLKILALCNVLVLLFTFSRGGYVAFLCGLLFLFYRAKRIILIILLVTLPFVYQHVLPDAVVDRIDMSFQETEYGETGDRDVASRLVMWEKSIQMWLDEPIIGNGVLSFQYQHWKNPHNQHLNFLVQGGIVGYGLFMWLFIAVFRDAWFLHRYANLKLHKLIGAGMCAATLSLFVSNIFGDRWSYYVLTGYFWVLAGIVVSLINVSLENNTNNITRSRIGEKTASTFLSNSKDC